MSDIMKIIEAFKVPCDCGMEHCTTVRDVQIGPGLVHEVGAILKKNDFPQSILLVADQKTLAAAAGIRESLTGFTVEEHIYEDLRIACMEHVEELEEKIKGRDVAILSVGTGSVNDPCRLAAARQNKLLCIFGTAPSMDGFASYSSPIVNKGFKETLPAKSPEVIIGDTEILAAAPQELKSAGFGDMVAKYVGLVDWELSRMLIDEYYCPRVAQLTRDAVDELMGMADKVTVNDPYTAGKIFEALLKTGIAMSFVQNSRPGSGCEHSIAHLIECIELRDGIIPNYHGDDVGVCTLKMLQWYNQLAEKENVHAHREQVDWDAVYDFYGSMADEVRALNTPDTIADAVDPAQLEAGWEKIRAIIRSVPSYEVCLEAMKKAGCKLTVEDIGKPQKLFDDCVKYSPYMRRRMTLLRLKGMLEV